jgi:hypothetical protein
MGSSPRGPWLSDLLEVGQGDNYASRWEHQSGGITWSDNKRTCRALPTISTSELEATKLASQLEPSPRRPGIDPELALPT